MIKSAILKFLLALMALGIKITLFASTIGHMHFENINGKSSLKNKSSGENWFIFEVEENAKNKYKVRGQLRVIPENSGYLMSIPEFYYKHLSSDSFELTSGRQLLQVHSFEKFWLRDSFLGRRNFTLLDETQEGLVGFKLLKKIQSISVTGFISPFFLPSINPYLKVKNGTITSPVGWEALPPTAVSIFDERVPVKYSLETQQLAKALIRPTIGLSIAYKKGGEQYSFYAFYKPENRPRVDAIGFLVQDLSEVNLQARGFINQHMITGLEAMRKFENLIITTGLEYINPRNKQNKKFNIHGLMIHPVYQEEAYLNVKVDYNLKNKNSLEFLYTQLLTSNENKNDDFNNFRVKWLQAVGAKVNWNFTDRLKAFLKYQYDVKNKAEIISTEINYLTASKLNIGVGGQVLKVSNENSFWGKYRTQDLIYSKMIFNF